MAKKKSKPKARNYKKPCHVLGYCPYGWLVELFPLHGNPTSWKDEDGNTLDLNVKPVKGAESCNMFGHDCPVFYAGEDVMG